MSAGHSSWARETDLSVGASENFFQNPQRQLIELPINKSNGLFLAGQNS